jgi:23S rRNA pseudouridine1911/1915/1917 synthase
MLRQFTVEEGHQGLRIDIYLTQVIEDIPSRTFVKKLIDGGQVKINGKAPKTNNKVAFGDTVVVDVDPSAWQARDLEPQNIPLKIFYEDPDIAVIYKPEGLTVHPASEGKSGTLANALAHHFQSLSDMNGPIRPGIVHRLDRETSGLLVVAKTNVAHARLGRQFEKHTVMKRYLALVEGNVQFDQGMIEAPLGRHFKYHDHRQIAKEGEGKEAVTLYQVLKRFGKTTLLALFPQTGRTHQLRVHLKHLGHPIIGDDKYGRKDLFPRLALHAQSLGFIHPITKRYIEFSSPVPRVFLQEKLK